MNVKLYMKSGNQITIKSVEDFKITYNGDTINSINVVFEDSKKSKGVMIESINLSQIEAIESFDA